ncbi:MAG TPA: TIGR03435 family protein [Terracidiphilus sp.]
MRFMVLVPAFCLALAAPRVGGQSGTGAGAPAPDILPGVPSYEVATIKPSTGNEGVVRMMFTADGVSVSGAPLQMLLRDAFRTEDDRIVGAPGWVKSTRYDVQAKVSVEDAPKLKDLKIDQRRSMLVPLLVDRFNLKYHHETRELPSYSLVIAKGGLKMKESAPPSAASKDGDRSPRSLMFNGPGNLESTGTGTQFLAHALSREVGRSIVDKTGLTGSYDYTLHWRPDNAPPPMAGGPAGGPPHGDAGEDAGGPSLFTALQEQLGLKLEASKGMEDVIVIDHIDQPSAN